jgi:HK97 family phage prohead protease
MTLLATPDLAGRRAAATSHPAEIPSTSNRAQAFAAQLRVATVKRDGKDFFHFHGYASTVEEPYEMYDMWGPYTEIVDAHAFDRTLSASPDVAFLVNHRGTTMARTKSGTLELSVDEQGLRSDAYCNPERTDVADLAHAINDEDVDQMSFAFRIVRGQWSPDYTEYRILEVDLDRGDVSAVNFGANPFTSISARAKQAEDAIAHLPAPYLRAMADRAEERLATIGTEARAAAPAPAAATSTGRTRADYLALLDAGLI